MFGILLAIENDDILTIIFSCSMIEAISALYKLYLYFDIKPKIDEVASYYLD